MCKNSFRYKNAFNININNKKNIFILNKSIINNAVKKTLIKMKTLNLINISLVKTGLKINLKLFENKPTIKNINKWK